MSTIPVLDELKASNNVERDLLSDIKDGMNKLLDGMVHQCFNRDDALDELEKRLEHKDRTQKDLHDLTAENEALREENRMLHEQIEGLQAAAVAPQSTPQNQQSAELSNTQKKKLLRRINHEIRQCNDMHKSNQAQASAREVESRKALQLMQKMRKAGLEKYKPLDKLQHMRLPEMQEIVDGWEILQILLWGENSEPFKRWKKETEAASRNSAEEKDRIRKRIAGLRELATMLHLDVTRLEDDSSYLNSWLSEGNVTAEQ